MKGACGSEEPLSREDRLRIVALNPLDLELYRHAVTVHKERIEEVAGPCRIRTNCTSDERSRPQLNMGEGALRSCGRMVYRSGRAGAAREQGRCVGASLVLPLLSLSPICVAVRARPICNWPE